MPPEVEKYIVGWRRCSLDGRALLFTLWRRWPAAFWPGLAPAWQCSRPNLTDALKEGGRGASAGRGRHRAAQHPGGAEVALAVVLLVGASLMVRGFSNLVHAGHQRWSPPRC